MDHRRDLVIRMALPGDARRLAEINHAAWVEAYGDIFSATLLAKEAEEDAVTTTASMWAERLSVPSADPGMTTLVAEDDGKVVGWIRVGPSHDDADSGEVHGIYVDPDRWGGRIGTGLMEAGLEILRSSGFSTGVLWVLEDNRRARRFYERVGWSSDGTIRHSGFDGELAMETRYRREL